MKRVWSALVMLALLAANSQLSAQGSTPNGDDSNDYWRRYTEKLPIGSTVAVRTSDGARFVGVLAIVDDSGITVEPKTRRPEKPRSIPFAQLQQVELKYDGGVSVARAVGIGAAVGGATFLGLLLIAFAAWSD